MFNIYIPHEKIGPKTNYTQAVNAIRKLKLGPPNMKPHAYIYETLLKKITKSRERHHHIIVGGDFNEEFLPQLRGQSNKVNMTTTMTKLGLFLATNPDGIATPTHIL